MRNNYLIQSNIREYLQSYRFYQIKLKNAMTNSKKPPSLFSDKPAQSYDVRVPCPQGATQSFYGKGTDRQQSGTIKKTGALNHSS